MAEIKAFLVPQSTVLAGKKTAYLERLQTYRAAQQRIQLPQRVILAQQSKAGEVLRLSQYTRAYVVPNYYTDLYRGVKVIPHVVSLGSISTTQTIEVSVWNANHHAVQLAAVELDNGEGISLSGAKVPSVLPPLALQKWEIKVGMNGAANIDCLFTLHVSGEHSVTLRITGSRSTDWQFFPDWSDDVVENLEFLTTVHQSLTGAEQRIAKRLSPRRTFEFKISCEGAERQRFENALFAYGVRVWSMPIFPQQTHLSHSASFGDKKLYLSTEGFEFESGGRAILLEAEKKEMVEIERVGVDFIEVKRSLGNAFSVAAKVFPLRAAVLTDMPQISRLSDSMATAQVRLQVYEHNNFSADISHLPVYRGHPVLEPTSEWSDNVTAQYQRLLKTLDNGTGLPHYVDTAQNAFQVTSHRFVLNGVEEQRKLRQLFYYLRGRQKAVWVASSTTDLIVVENIKGHNISVHAVDYTNSLLGVAGRQDVRIELIDGSVFYRRIVSAVVINSDVEQLTFDGDALDVPITYVAKISFLTLSRLESDSVSWVHQTNSVATVAVSFRGLRDELEV